MRTMLKSKIHRATVTDANIVAVINPDGGLAGVAGIGDAVVALKMARTSARVTRSLGTRRIAEGATNSPRSLARTGD